MSYRRNDDWPRSLVIRGYVHPLSRMEVIVLEKALAAYLTVDENSRWHPIARSLFRVIKTGHPPHSEFGDLTRWRDEQRALDLATLSDAPAAKRKEPTP